MLDYTNLRSTAINLLKHFGNDVVLSRSADENTPLEGTDGFPLQFVNGDVIHLQTAVFDPATGEYAGGTPITITGKGVRMMFAKSEVNGVTIQASDVRLLFQAGNGLTLINDNCLFAGINYRVMDILAISPAGTDVYYDIQLRH